MDVHCVADVVLVDGNDLKIMVAKDEFTNHRMKNLSYPPPINL
jgi:hypothetical protein